MTEAMKAITKEMQNGPSVREVHEWQLSLQSEFLEDLKAAMSKSQIPVFALVVAIITCGVMLSV
ncbi:hypothetical protein [Pseudomonas sp. GM67]|uniref:hypothetical protein n=1 Tax=Pseudomonas sp. GM67 TaxID=1144335 RepID=UPI000270BBD3|nr:hypothetical protein [Pseudomonas sp. GM67]EJM92416.1 hypothetical protein PMI33_00673 [Pseudomonas sp. GM67]